MKRTALLTALALAFPVVHAQDSRIVYDPKGQPVFEVRFFGPESGPFLDDGYFSRHAEWEMNEDLKGRILAGVQYWAGIITPVATRLPAVINIGTVEERNAYSVPIPTAEHDGIRFSALQARLQGRPGVAMHSGADAALVFGQFISEKAPYIPSQLPYGLDAQMAAVAMHELAHSLGIRAMVVEAATADDEMPRPYFSHDAYGTWTAGLRDDNGNPARPGQPIVCAGCGNELTPDAFDLSQDSGYFSGPHVDDVLAGAMPGVPVRIVSEDGDIDTDYLSHIELKNGVMSHQSYRSYTGLMEVELAVMQDIGYQIDRRDFYGFSVYGDGQTIVNRHGYFQRNAAGTAYLPGQYNTATQGVGLHVYGSRNTLYQQADLLTQGAGAAGVRIDGEGNTLVVQPGVRVHANGPNGRGVLFAYGKNHNLVQRGSVEALGNLGVALEFSFGDNAMGRLREDRGSYIRESFFEPIDMLAELEGPLVSSVDISGRVAGAGSAIAISRNALVGSINVLRGASIQGDIYSLYNQLDGDGKQRLTQLTFGLQPDIQGRATDRPDPGFALRYDGNINGIDNLALTVAGGRTSLNGEHRIYSMQIWPTATLEGDSSYQINGAGTFLNNGVLSPGAVSGRVAIEGNYRQGPTGKVVLEFDGTGAHDVFAVNGTAFLDGNVDASFLNYGVVAPGNSMGTITIDGNYQQSPSGKLVLEFDNTGAHDTFAVSGTAQLDGQLVLVPEPGWYAPDWRLDFDRMFSAGETTGAFSGQWTALSSPTLSLRLRAENGVMKLAMARDPGAYSRHGRDGNARAVGRSLERVVVSAKPDIQPLYRALDFSAPDGSGVTRTLDQLSSADYSVLYASSLARERQLDDMVASPGASGSATTRRAEGWRVLAMPFGGGASQRRQGQSVGYTSSSYGVLGGVERSPADYPNWTLGLHGAVSAQRVSLRAPETGAGKATALDLGLHGRYAPDAMTGPYAAGSVRLGIENGRMRRSAAIEDYNANFRSQWTGWSGSASVEGGYRWPLNEHISAGPLAGLSYTTVSRPGLTESGDAGRLKLDAERFNALRMSVGAAARVNVPLASGSAVQADLRLSWDHELLDTNLVQGARFAGYDDGAFRSRNQVVGRDSMGVQGGLRYQTGKGAEFGARIASNLFAPGYDAVAGNLYASWRL